MARTSPTAPRYNSSRDALRQASEISSYLHPDYIAIKPDWDVIRDCIEGEARIKSKGEAYLPPIGKTGQSYADYKGRAVFVNMVARTVSALTGTVFRRPLKVINGSARAVKRLLEHITVEGYDANLFAKQITREILTTGRVGILTDRPLSEGNAYLAMYVAENILSWRSKRVNGRTVLDYVLLREISETMSFIGEETASKAFGRPTPTIRATYRVLTMRNGVYVQEVYDGDQDSSTLTLKQDTKVTIIPKHNGAPLDHIPFVIMGPESPSAAMQRSPILDIANLNIAHYRVSAQLEAGRYYTAIPVYWTNVRPGEENGEYTIGPSTVLELPPESKLGIAEYYGTGLAHLAQSLLEKEQHISDLGGRVIHARSGEASMSDHAAQIKNVNETSILLNVTESVNSGLTTALRELLTWENIDGVEDISVRLNQDFKLNNVGARELRAVALLYQSGMLPVSELYRVLQENEYVGENVSLEEFEAQLNDLASFPHQPDVSAMHDGYPDAAARLSDEQNRRLFAHESSMARMTGAQDVRSQTRQFGQDQLLADKQSQLAMRLEDKKAQTAVKAAKAKPKNPPIQKNADPSSKNNV